MNSVRQLNQNKIVELSLMFDSLCVECKKFVNSVVGIVQILVWPAWLLFCGNEAQCVCLALPLLFSSCICSCPCKQWWLTCWTRVHHFYWKHFQSGSSPELYLWEFPSMNLQSYGSRCGAVIVMLCIGLYFTFFFKTSCLFRFLFIYFFNQNQFLKMVWVNPYPKWGISSVLQLIYNM